MPVKQCCHRDLCLDSHDLAIERSQSKKIFLLPFPLVTWLLDGHFISPNANFPQVGVKEKIKKNLKNVWSLSKVKAD